MRRWKLPVAWIDNCSQQLGARARAFAYFEDDWYCIKRCFVSDLLPIQEENLLPRFTCLGSESNLSANAVM